MKCHLGGCSARPPRRSRKCLSTVKNTCVADFLVRAKQRCCVSPTLFMTVNMLLVTLQSVRRGAFVHTAVAKTTNCRARVLRAPLLSRVRSAAVTTRASHHCFLCLSNALIAVTVCGAVRAGGAGRCPRGAAPLPVPVSRPRRAWVMLPGPVRTHVCWCAARGPHSSIPRGEKDRARRPLPGTARSCYSQ